MTGNAGLHFDILLAGDDDAPANDEEPSGASIFALTPNPLPGPSWAVTPELPLFTIAATPLDLRPNLWVRVANQHLKITGRRTAVGNIQIAAVIEIDLIDPATDPGAAILPRDQPGFPPPPPTPAPPLPPIPPPTPTEAELAELEAARRARLDPLAEPLPDPCEIQPLDPLGSAFDICDVQ